MSESNPSPPPIQPKRTPAPQPLTYQTPTGRSLWTHNKWWMILLRAIAGGVAALVCLFIGGLIGNATNQPVLVFMPAMAVFAGLLFVCIRYRRFGYLSGFILAPILTAAALVVFLFLACSGYIK